jgi:hypothetical protein
MGFRLFHPAHASVRMTGVPSANTAWNRIVKEAPEIEKLCLMSLLISPGKQGALQMMREDTPLGVDLITVGTSLAYSIAGVLTQRLHERAYSHGRKLGGS